ERRVDARGGDHRPIADGNHAVRRSGAERLDDAVHGAELVVETNGDGLVPPRVFQLIAPVAREHETHAQLLGRLAERADLIPRRRGNDEDLRQTSCMSSGDGSAQQYHASVMCGTARRRVAFSRTLRIADCCSASTRGSRWRHCHVIDAGSNAVTTAWMSGNSSSGEPLVMRRRMAS